MYKCEVCGREMFQKNKVGGYTVCSKHMHQYCKYGKFLDNNPRTQNDLNGYRIVGKKVIFDVYNIKNLKVDEFIIDIDDIEKVKYHKWRMDTNHHIITGNSTNKNPRRELSRLLLDLDNTEELVVDHIDGDPRNNTRTNLRVCKQSDNLKNKHYMSNNTTGYQGVYWDKNRRRWAVEIQDGYRRFRLGRYDNKNEAIFVRLFAETLLFHEFMVKEHQEEYKEIAKKIDRNRIIILENYVHSKLNI